MGICVIGRVAADEYSDAPGISIHRRVGHCKRISYRDCRFDFEWSYLFVQSIVAYIPNVLAALLVLLVGNVIARFIARSVRIGAVNLNVQYARFWRVGVKWIVIVPHSPWLWNI